MQAQGTPNRAVATRLVAAIRTFARSEVGWRAKLIFATILVLLIGANGLNVANSLRQQKLDVGQCAERHNCGIRLSRLNLRWRSSQDPQLSPFWRASPKSGSACFGVNL